MTSRAQHGIGLAGLLLVASAWAEEPTADGVTEPPAPALMTFEKRIVRPTAPPCVGPLVPDAPPCRVFFTLGTIGAVFTIEALRPAESRLTRLSDVSPFPDGQPVLRSGAYAKPGLLVSGFSSGSTFVGLGEFDMRPAGDR